MPYSLTDSVVGIWLVNLLSRQRHPMCIVRKRIVCQGGCGEWYAYYTVCVFVEWCLRCLADVVFPSTKHDGAPFLPDSDSERAQLGGTHIKKRAACIQIRGDCAEFCERLGFPTWQSSYRPCFCCTVPRADLHDATGANVFSSPHLLNDDVDYQWACERCELLVRVTQDQHRRLCLLLRYDKRQKGARGLSLAALVSELKLKAGDRLAPCSGLPDVGAFFRISSFPPEGVPLLRWRAENETLCLRRCPLFKRAIGLNHCSGLGFTSYKPFGCHAGVLPPRCMGVLAQWCLVSGCVEQNGELQKFCFGSSVRVVGLVRVQAAEPLYRELNSSC